jgi:hypothetical protein
LAVIPSLTIPTGAAFSTDQVEGGVSVPFSWSFAEQASLDLTGDLSFVHDSATNSYDTELTLAGGVSFDIVGPLGGYAEFSGVATTGGAARPVFSTGALWSVTDDVILDLGANIGLARAADDYVLFLGLSVRF